ncbi:MAG: Rrf2 family transcriptional regulator [Calditrichaeota bacterium]|nr:Rrf2 family transcriptional regulator [Calditrichota bacterium]
MLSKTCDYGLRAALYIATHEREHFVSIRRISEKLQISFHFLTKILQILTEKGIMISFRGPNGGVKLARKAEEITLLDIILAIDGPGLFTDCALGLEKCWEGHPCPLHQEWKQIRTDLKNIFQSKTLADLAFRIKSDTFRISDLAVTT